MELLNIEQAIFLVNIAMILYLLSIVYQVIRYSWRMAPTALHHLHTHGYMSMFALISINLFYFEGWTIPLIFSSFYSILHLLKENYRLVHNNGYWTQGIKEI